MASIAFPNISKSLKVPNGTTYNYVHIEPKGNKPYLLFLHGWPDSSYGWSRQIPYFSDLGYGLIVPDLLGYGGTDKPQEKEAYKLKKMCDEVIGILDHHEIKEVIGIGHDWGCIFLSRFVHYYPTRFTKYAFLDVAYNPAGPFSIDAINNAAYKDLGYTIFGYWHFFNDEDAGKLMDDHSESMRSLKYAASPAFIKEHMSPYGACRTYFETGKTGPIASWATPTDLSYHDKIFSQGGFHPTLNWYKAQMADLNSQDEMGITEEQKQINVPTLLVTAKNDPLAVPQWQVDGTKPFVKDLTIVEIDSGHFVQMEKPEETNKALEKFFAA